MTLKECYTILQVTQDSSLDDIKRAYRKRAFELHPDLHPDLATANQSFQLLNEAYVILTKILEAKNQAGQTKTDDKVKKEAPKDTKQAQSSTQSQTTKEDTKTSATNAHTKTEQSTTEEKQQTHTKRPQDTVYAAQHEVIQDILADPFARRVFEDIYSEIRKQHDSNTKTAYQAKHLQRQAASTAKPKTSTGTNTAQSAWAWPFPHAKKPISKDENAPTSLSDKAKGWMRQQIDEAQTVTIAAKRLFPGARIRLQIRQGLSNTLKTIDVTLPPDFSSDTPIRLKGMGKKLGKWQGDFYLTLKATQEK